MFQMIEMVNHLSDILIFYLHIFSTYLLLFFILFDVNNLNNAFKKDCNEFSLHYCQFIS